MEGAAGKRKDAPGHEDGRDQDAENSRPAAGMRLASASVKRRFVPPKMVGAAAAAKSTQPLASRANLTQRVGASKPAAKPAAGSAAEDKAQYFTVLYTKKSNKKRQNKTFSDGILQVTSDGICMLYNEEGKVVTKSRVANSYNMPPGAEISLNSMELEVDSRIDAQQFRSGSCFAKSASPSRLAPAAAGAGASSRAFKTVLGGGAAGSAQPPVQPQGLHSPEAEGALVLNEAEWRGGQAGAAGRRPVAPIVVDPYLCRHLRPHQRQGVKFLYECTMGLRDANRLGAILADDMGLGKTLQVLSLVWTALRQGPAGRPAAGKVVIVAPSSLCANWAAEAKKWLGNERLKVMVIAAGAQAQQQVQDFKFGTVFRACVISYETVRKFSKDLKGNCDILICDEGHRLKSSGGNKTIDALLALDCPRRILLTGTPLQNNMDEYFALVDFVNPGSLATSLSQFKRVYGDVITRSRDRGASDEDKELGHERSQEMQRRIDGFLLRRTSEINQRFLPDKTTFTVFCRPSLLQVKLYRHILNSRAITSLLSASGTSDGSCILTSITKLKKVCNHPDMLRQKGDDAAAEAEPLDDLFPADHVAGAPADSGKLACLEALLQALLGGDDRVVVVSNSTAALDIVGGLCACLGLPTCRISGATAVEGRQDVVNTFNSQHTPVRVCLLSTRAGGAGLNLIGANHLVMFDTDWNPALDQQAMARIWRDGQKKPCFIYRLLTTGTIDEKIYQRQLMKGELADAMQQEQGAKKGASRFTREELRDLFSLNTQTDCDTHDLLAKLPGGGDWQDGGGSQSDAARAVAVAACPVVSFVHVMAKSGETAAAAAAAAAATVGDDGAGPSMAASAADANSDDAADDVMCLEADMDA